MPITVLLVHRCRLYKLATKSEFFPDGKFTEVWDTLNTPHENINAMPKGELLATEEDTDHTKVREKMRPHWETHKVVTAGTWGKRCVG